MRGYHYLLRIGHLLNVLAAFSVKLVKVFKEKGPQGFIEFVRTTLSGLWLESVEMRERLNRPCRSPHTSCKKMSFFPDCFN